MKKMEPSYQRSMVIVHGLSEQSICSNIKSNLRLPQEITEDAVFKSQV